MEIALSKNNIPIRLTDERWMHIVETHDDLAGYYYEVLDTIANPDLIIKGHRQEKLAVKRYSKKKNLVSVYNESKPDGFVITAFFTSELKRLKKRGVIWQK